MDESSAAAASASVSPIRKCGDMLALWLTEPDGVSGKYANAVSFRREVLQEMLNTLTREEDRELYTIEPIRVFFDAIEIDREGNRGAKRVLFCNKNKNFDEIRLPLYASHCSNGIDEILVARQPPSADDMNFSLSPIELDRFYDEGIMNANDA